MIIIHHAKNGMRQVADMQNIYAGQTALLVGGSPSLREQPIHLLEQRGVLTMAMNNAAVHFRPTMWVSGDNPACYEPQILLDPTIIKFANMPHADIDVCGRKFKNMPNMYFYMPETNVSWDEYLGIRGSVPWYNNTLFVGIHILYMLGVRRIILAGSEFGFSKEGSMYAHSTDQLGDFQKKWNLDLYNSLVRELRMLKPIFDQAGLKFMDCSKRSRISQVYDHISLESAVDLCLEGFPNEMISSNKLPHCSKFAPVPIQQRIAQWPGHHVIGGFKPETVVPATNKMQSIL